MLLKIKNVKSLMKVLLPEAFCSGQAWLCNRFPVPGGSGRLSGRREWLCRGMRGRSVARGRGRWPQP